MQTFRDRLKEWTDVDIAQFELGVVLGLWGPDTYLTQKDVFWTHNRISNGLNETLRMLVRFGALEYNDEGDRLRSIPEYRGIAL